MLGAASSAWRGWRAQQAVASTTGASGKRRGATLANDGAGAASMLRNAFGLAEAPRGPSGGGAGVDWSTLAEALGGAATGGEAFEACCFVESTRTSTQCSIFRQARNHPA